MNLLPKTVLFSACCVLQVQADELNIYQESLVAEVILSTTDYCAWSADEYSPEQAGTMATGSGFVENFKHDDGNFVIIESSKLNCGFGRSTSCSSSGCAMWIIGPTEQKLLRGKLINVPEGFDASGARTLYCADEVVDWEGCVDIRTLIK